KPPTPGVPVSISEATITSHASPSESRYPVNTYGSDAGTMIFVSIFKRESRSTRPTFRWSGLIDRTPTAVLITVGHIAQSAIVNTAAGSDFWKITRPSGSQASG